MAGACHLYSKGLKEMIPEDMLKYVESYMEERAIRATKKSDRHYYKSYRNVNCGGKVARRKVRGL